jgi:hypothetical protein
MAWLSIDPGVWKSGCALWSEGGELLRAWTARHRRGPMSEPEAWRRMALAVEVEEPLSALAVEVMQADGRTRGKERALFSVSGVVGSLATRFSPAPVSAYTPREWKGSVPKDVMQRRLAAKLTAAELSRVCARATHDAWDAIGIGARHMGGVSRWRE